MQVIIDSIESKQLNGCISLVISNRCDAFILERAKKQALNTVYINYSKDSCREEAESVMVAELQRHDVQLVLLIGWMRILTPTFVRAFRGRIWNVHPSLLPKYSGGMNLDVHRTVLENKEKETGCTLHEVTEEVDAGEILCQRTVLIEEGETPETLKEKVQKVEGECFLECLQQVIEGRLVLGETGVNTTS